MTTFSLPAVGSLNRKSSVALSADFLVAVKFLSDGSDSGIHDTASESQDQVQGGLLLDVVVGQTPAV